MVQMMREEALAAFRAWQEKSDKIRLLTPSIQSREDDCSIAISSSLKIKPP